MITYTWYAVSFINTNCGALAGQDGIFLTSDGGSTWVLQQAIQWFGMTDISLVDLENCTAVGIYGTIIKTSNANLPVELTSFIATVKQNSVLLEWATATEINNQGFEIERKTEKNEWRTIGFEEGKGTTTEPQEYSFIDDLFNASTGKLYYRLKQIDFDGSFEYSKIVDVEVGFPTEFSLSQNYPNPFNPTTSIQYTVGSLQFVTFKVYDVLGKEIATLINETKPAGAYEVEFNGTGLPSGIYFYRITAGSYSETRKMVLLR